MKVVEGKLNCPMVECKSKVYLEENSLYVFYIITKQMFLALLAWQEIYTTGHNLLPFFVHLHEQNCIIG